MNKCFLFCLILLSLSTVSCANNQQRLFNLDCDQADFETRFPSACATAFDFEPNGSSQGAQITNDFANEIYAAELWISLDQINRYAIILAEGGNGWQLSAFAGRKDGQFGENGVYGRTFRSVHFDVPEARVDTLKAALKERDLLRLQTPNHPMTKTDTNGETVNIVCTDGASLSAKQYSKDYIGSASRHQCRGRTEIDDFTDALFDLAVEFDPDLEPYRFTIPKDGA